VQPGLPGSIADAFNVPAMPRTEGMPKPMSETEQLAAERQKLMGNGMLTDQLLLEGILGDQAPVKVAGADGPVYSTPGAAARTNAPAYVDAGSQAAPDVQNYRTPEGLSGTAVYTQDRGWVDTQNRQPLPPGTQTYKAATSGGTDAALGGTNANVTLGQRIVADADYAMSRVNEYEQFLLAPENAGAAGLPGNIQGFFQDVQSGVGELVAAYGTKGLPVEAISKLANDVGVKQGYDPGVRAALSYAIEMAYQQAKMGDPGGEMNVSEFNRLIPLFSGGIGGNKAVLAALQPLKTQIAARRKQGASLVGGALGAPPTPVSPDPFANGLGAASPATNGPQPGTVEDGYRFKGGDPADPNSWEPV
jgi:hypothetical protein